MIRHIAQLENTHRLQLTCFKLLTHVSPSNAVQVWRQARQWPWFLDSQYFFFKKIRPDPFNLPHVVRQYRLRDVRIKKKRREGKGRTKVIKFVWRKCAPGKTNKRCLYLVTGMWRYVPSNAVKHFQSTVNSVRVRSEKVNNVVPKDLHSEPKGVPKWSKIL